MSTFTKVYRNGFMDGCFRMKAKTFNGGKQVTVGATPAETSGRRRWSKGLKGKTEMKTSQHQICRLRASL